MRPGDSPGPIAGQWGDVLDFTWRTFTTKNGQRVTFCDAVKMKKGASYYRVNTQTGTITPL